MKYGVLLFSLFSLGTKVIAQEDKLSDPEPYFTAVIVSNLDRSISWYTNNLGFEVASKRDNIESGFRQANLKRGNALIELIELESAINPKDVVPNYNNKTKLLGIFKFGFKVSDFDRWMKYLDEKAVQKYGTVVIDPISRKKMIILLDPDGNYVQLFEK